MPDGKVCPDQFRGYLWKWTNYIKGYQKRWCVLSNGLLSYYRFVLIIFQLSLLLGRYFPVSKRITMYIHPTLKNNQMRRWMTVKPEVE